MMVLPKNEYTRFENAVIALRAATVLFDLVQTLEGSEYDANIYQILLDDVLCRYRSLFDDLEAVFVSLRSDKPPEAL